MMVTVTTTTSRTTTATLFRKKWIKKMIVTVLLFLAIGGMNKTVHELQSTAKPVVEGTTETVSYSGMTENSFQPVAANARLAAPRFGGDSFCPDWRVALSRNTSVLAAGLQYIPFWHTDSCSNYQIHTYNYIVISSETGERECWGHVEVREYALNSTGTTPPLALSADGNNIAVGGASDENRPGGLLQLFSRSLFKQSNSTICRKTSTFGKTDSCWRALGGADDNGIDLVDCIVRKQGAGQLRVSALALSEDGRILAVQFASRPFSEATWSPHNIAVWNYDENMDTWHPVMTTIVVGKEDPQEILGIMTSVHLCSRVCHRMDEHWLPLHLWKR